MVLHEATKNEDYMLPDLALMPVIGWQDESLHGSFLLSGDDDEGEEDTEDEENFDDMDDDFEDDFEDEEDDFDYEEDADYDDFDE
ncbi:MAG: hypothetical protein LBH43_10305 [Treponema sp.]|nr:hypothetical protein [Treponema sp.]